MLSHKFVVSATDDAGAVWWQSIFSLLCNGSSHFSHVVRLSSSRGNCLQRGPWMDHSGRGQTGRKELSVTASFTSGLLSGRGNRRNGAFRETGGAVSRRGTRILFRPRQCEGLLSARAPNPPSAGVLHTSFDTVGGGPSHFRWHPRVTRPDTDSALVGGGWCAGGRGVWCGGGWLQDPHQPHRRPAASVATRRSLSAVPARAGSDAAPALTPFILRVLLRCRRRRYPRLFFQRPHAPL